jgi:hypothetical protein
MPILVILLACGGPVPDFPLPPGTAGGADTADTSVSGPDTGWYLMSYEGAASVVPGASYSGTEGAVFTSGLSGETLCRVGWSVDHVAAVDVSAACATCVFAFDLKVSSPAVTEGSFCDALYGPADRVDGWQFRLAGMRYDDYGVTSDYVGYYFSGYGWYPVGYATWKPPLGEFEYAWAVGYGYYYPM